ncbi:energy transducer TonB [Flaviramulus sp. BrNp1-15]|uniref:energy transducer TonB n=1 Tax=Flaviramulus sp. BrNp1-15 TaxID=2916754 RepID=UPI001EE96B29|nr:energy transducer TonB [Flaviramulus sp. BrNp1-15]ULC59411.1 energy transducer TonB [Flaviramulus sp. BrNp1-15]
MSNLKKTHEPIRQNGEIVKKSQKHDANLQKNSTFYFQIGLIVCLLATFGLLEMKFETTIHEYGDLPPLEEPTYIDIPIVITEVPELIEPVVQKKSKQPDSYKQVSNETDLNPVIDTPVKPIIKNPVLDPDAIPDLPEKPVEPENVPFFAIQNAPIYPGCEKAKNNNERKKCMSEKITKLVQRKFNGSDIAVDYGLTGKQKIDVEFTIDKTGHVTNIKTRSPHPKLDKEAVRVINFIPEMTPGKQRDKNVGVIYNLPIIFQVQ